MSEPKKKRWRTTLVIEAESEQGFEVALQHGVALAREHVIGMTISLPTVDRCPAFIVVQVG